MTKTEALDAAARDEWLDMSVDECVEYADDHGFSDDDAGIVDLTAAEEHFVDAWVEREWDTDFRHDMDSRV